MNTTKLKEKKMKIKKLQSLVSLVAMVTLVINSALLTSPAEGSNGNPDEVIRLAVDIFEGKKFTDNNSSVQLFSMQRRVGDEVHFNVSVQTSQYTWVEVINSISVTDGKVVLLETVEGNTSQAITSLTSDNHLLIEPNPQLNIGFIARECWLEGDKSVCEKRELSSEGELVTTRYLEVDAKLCECQFAVDDDYLSTNAVWVSKTILMDVAIESATREFSVSDYSIRIRHSLVGEPGFGIFVHTTSTNQSLLDWHLEADVGRLSQEILPRVSTYHPFGRSKMQIYCWVH